MFIFLSQYGASITKSISVFGPPHPNKGYQSS